MKITYLTSAVARFAIPALALALPALAFSQSVIQQAKQPYVAQPEIKFSIGAPASAPIKAMVQPVASPAQPAQTWSIEATDIRLVDAFTRWTKAAGMQLRWDATRHVELGAMNQYDGDVSEAMIEALSSPSIANSDHPLEICFYPNRPVLARVTRRGEQWKDCPSIQSPYAKQSN